ncbi:ACAP [Mytilus edulis]|uniref:ACAP n=1 Tax=Mytilus edulis TaxID=6550 RepID=A0A8S3VC25_MYTED|nr:ACAP [Mytilus edulis]
MYSDLTSAVFSGGKLSNWFKLHRGVRQGSVLSAKLYLIFINDLIDKLESSQQGAFIHDLNASTPVQADDISIIATDRQSSQVMVKICEEYSIRWSFSFSAGKSQLLHFGKPTTGTDVLLYNEPISTVKMAKHCGINLYTCLKTMDRTIDVCRTLRATVISLIRLGVHPAILNPIVCSKFVKQVCYPKALYGCELWGKLTSTEWLMLERTQHYICKNIQGLPRRTRSDMCLPMIGWFSIESYVDEKKLYFLGRICNLPCESISFRILIRRVNDFKYNDGSYSNLGFTVDIINILRKYELSSYFNDFCETGTFSNTSNMEAHCQNSSAAFEIVDWTRRFNIDDDFVAFTMIKKYTPHPAWTTALKRPYLRTQAHYLISDLSQITSSIHGENGVIEGYLFKKTSKGFKSWVRRWFAIQNNQLIYKKRSGSHNALSIMEEDLRLCTSHLLQADSDEDCKMWITEITSGISRAFKDAENQELKQEEDDPSPQENKTDETELPTTPKLSKIFMDTSPFLYY